MEDTNAYIKKLKKQREEAILNNDGLEYIKTSSLLGMDENEIPCLAKLGYEQLALEENAKEDSSLEKTILASSEKDPYLSNLQKLHNIASRRFSELQVGEKISPREYKQRLKQLKDAGWPVKQYSNMKLKQVRKYFSQVRNRINKLYQEKRSNQGLLF